MLNGGAFKCYLSPKTSKYMTVDEMGTGIAMGPIYLPRPWLPFRVGGCPLMILKVGCST